MSEMNQALDLNNKTVQCIVNTMQNLYAASKDILKIYLYPYHVRKDGTVFDEQYFLVDIKRPSADIDKIISAATTADMSLYDQGIVSATDLLTDEEDPELLILIPRREDM